MKHIWILITPTLVGVFLALACEVPAANTAQAASVVEGGRTAVAAPNSQNNSRAGKESGKFIKHVKVTFDIAALGNSSYEQSNYWAINPNNSPLREIVTVLNLTNELPPHEPLTLTYVYYNSTGDLQPNKVYTYSDFFINGTGYFSSDYFNAIEGTFSVTNLTTAILSARLFYPELDFTSQSDHVENHYFMDSNSGKRVHVTITSRTNGLVTLDCEE